MNLAMCRETQLSHPWLQLGRSAHSRGLERLRVCCGNESAPSSGRGTSQACAWIRQYGTGAVPGDPSPRRPPAPRFRSTTTPSRSRQAYLTKGRLCAGRWQRRSNPVPNPGHPLARTAKSHASCPETRCRKAISTCGQSRANPHPAERGQPTDPSAPNGTKWVPSPDCQMPRLIPTVLDRDGSVDPPPKKAPYRSERQPSRALRGEGTFRHQPKARHGESPHGAQLLQALVRWLQDSRTVRSVDPVEHHRREWLCVLRVRTIHSCGD